MVSTLALYLWGWGFDSRLYFVDVLYFYHYYYYLNIILSNVHNCSFSLSEKYFVYWSLTSSDLFFFFFFPFQTSDYINASFMDGYKMTNAYIATQGKKPLFIILIPSAVCSSAFMFFWTNPELYYASSKKAVFASSGVFFRDIGWGERYTSLLISRSFGNVFWLFLFASCQAGTAQHLAFIPTSSCAHLFMVVASQQ